MFVLPPPPRYPQAGAYVGLGGPGAIPMIETNNTVTKPEGPEYQFLAGAYVGLGGPGAMPMIETNNTVTKPEGPEYQFLVGEGTYVLKEDLHLATPPPHPSEAPIINPNPLATNPQPASVGTKVSLLRLDVRPPPPSFYRGPFANGLSSLTNTNTSIQEHPSERYSTEAGMSSDGGNGSLSDAPQTSMTLVSAPAFGDGNAALAPINPKDVGKKKKPKNNMTKSNSSFISRVIVNENLSKKLTDRKPEGVFCFANINRAFQWLDLSAWQKQDYLTKILFTRAHCLCHDINPVTKSLGHIDVIMGFSTGEIIWWEPVSQRYTRLNKNGIINGTPVSEIRWIPGSDNLFLAGHMDGSLVVYDKEKEDAPFVPEEELATNGVANGDTDATDSGESSAPKNANPNTRIHIYNPDNRHLAVVSEDGSLRIIDYLKEELLDLYHSYYGGLISVCWSPDGKYVLTGGQDDLISIWLLDLYHSYYGGLISVCWSPDGKYVLTGGQDDLISIWSVIDHAIIARCQGHQSWVTSVAFDPWRCDDKNYRFGSVGEDRRLCLWDFNVGMLSRPKAASVRQRGSISSRFPGSTSLQRLETANTTTSGRLRSNSALSTADIDDDEEGIVHPVEPRSHTAMLPPVMSKVIHPSPMCWLEFTEDYIMTSCKSGHIRTWSRPTESAVPKDGATQPAK
ncbi:catabolite repression protein creC like [Verticillium longisporum]|nr:catabolite repression protein creC like [Verticillium longisporum]